MSKHLHIPRFESASTVPPPPLMGVLIEQCEQSQSQQWSEMRLHKTLNIHHSPHLYRCSLSLFSIVVLYRYFDGCWL